MWKSFDCVKVFDLNIFRKKLRRFCKKMKISIKRWSCTCQHVLKISDAENRYKALLLCPLQPSFNTRSVKKRNNFGWFLCHFDWSIVNDFFTQKLYCQKHFAKLRKSKLEQKKTETEENALWVLLWSTHKIQVKLHNVMFPMAVQITATKLSTMSFFEEVDTVTRANVLLYFITRVWLSVHTCRAKLWDQKLLCMSLF